MRQIPHSQDSEIKILGTILLHHQLLPEVIELLSADDFYIATHRAMYLALVDLLTQKKPITEDNLVKQGVDIIDIIGFQADFTDNLEPYIAQVKDCSKRRKLIEQSTSLLKICYDERDTEKALNDAEKLIFDMSKDKATNAVSIKDAVQSAFRYLSESQKKCSVIKSDILDLDHLIRGFEPGQFIVIAARPSMGKTALALCLGLNTIKQGIGVGFFSIEMTVEQMALRALALEAEISMQELYMARIFTDVSKFSELCTAATNLGEYPLEIDDASKTLIEIRTQARKWVKEKGIRVLIIDYLGLIRPTRHRDSRNLEVAELSEGLKSLAKELRVPIICLSQLSRDVEKRMDNRPKLSDLRDSGAIEQDADIVMFLYRENYYNPDFDVNAAELIIAKNRNGKTGRVNLVFTPETMRFE